MSGAREDVGICMRGSRDALSSAVGWKHSLGRAGRIRDI